MKKKAIQADPMEKYQTEDDMRTLMKAHEISNHEGRLKAVQKMAKEHKAAIHSIAALKAKRDEVVDNEDLPDEVKADKTANHPEPSEDVQDEPYVKKVKKAREPKDTTKLAKMCACDEEA